MYSYHWLLMWNISLHIPTVFAFMDQAAAQQHLIRFHSRNASGSLDAQILQLTECSSPVRGTYVPVDVLVQRTNTQHQTSHKRPASTTRTTAERKRVPYTTHYESSPNQLCHRVCFASHSRNAADMAAGTSQGRSDYTQSIPTDPTVVPRLSLRIQAALTSVIVQASTP